MNEQREMRRCNDCGEEWEDDGLDDYECPFCGGEDTYIVEEEDEPSGI